MHLILFEKWYWLNKTNYNFNSHKGRLEKKKIYSPPTTSSLTTQLPPLLPSNCVVFPSLISCPFFLPSTPPIPLPPLSRSSGQVAARWCRSMVQTKGEPEISDVYQKTARSNQNSSKMGRFST